MSKSFVLQYVECNQAYYKKTDLWYTVYWMFFELKRIMRYLVCRYCIMLSVLIKKNVKIPHAVDAKYGRNVHLYADRLFYFVSILLETII